MQAINLQEASEEDGINIADMNFNLKTKMVDNTKRMKKELSVLK